MADLSRSNFMVMICINSIFMSLNTTTLFCQVYKKPLQWWATIVKYIFIAHIFMTKLFGGNHVFSRHVIKTWHFGKGVWFCTRSVNVLFKDTFTSVFDTFFYSISFKSTLAFFFSLFVRILQFFFFPFVNLGMFLFQQVIFFIFSQLFLWW